MATKYVKCVDNGPSADRPCLLEKGKIYKVEDEWAGRYQLEELEGLWWNKCRFKEVMSVPYHDEKDKPVATKFVKCINDYDAGGVLKAGTVYEVVKETEHSYYLEGVKPNGWNKHRFVEDKPENYKDNINRPAHYTMGKIEVYDFIKAWDLSFAEGNVVKYTVRAPHKGKKLEDLKKARWYLDQLIKEAEEAE